MVIVNTAIRPLVMVVDDEEELVELYSRFIELSGLDCEYFTDPKEALDNFSLNYHRYSLVITDLRMPSLGGIDFAKRIREYNKSVKILLITNFLIESNLDYDEVKQAGIDMVFEKPFHFKDLRLIIKEILGA
jgi:DNA-binding response OmpR family regulator